MLKGALSIIVFSTLVMCWFGCSTVSKEVTTIGSNLDLETRKYEVFGMV